LRWVVALMAVAAAAGLRFALDPVLGSAHPFPLFLGAVIVAAWFGGALPAIAAALAGYLVADYFFIEPGGFLSPRSAEALAGLGVYVVSSALIAGLGGAMHAARRRAESSEERSRADVTKQAHAAEELRSQREELRLVADTMPAGVVRVSADLRYVWVNRVFASWVGRPAEDIIGRPIVEVIGERDWRELRPHVERALAGERVEYERLARFARIGERWISSIAEPTRDEAGAPNGLVAVVTDIHVRRQVEAALNATREQLQLVADSMPAAVALCSRDLRYVWINRRYAQWLGMNAAAVVGRPIEEIIGASGGGCCGATPRAAHATPLRLTLRRRWRRFRARISGPTVLRT